MWLTTSNAKAVAIALLLMGGNSPPSTVANAASGSGQGTFIAHPTVDDTSISRKDVTSIFTFNTSLWANGARIVVILPPEGSTAFNNLAIAELGLDPRAYKELITSRSATGAGNAVFTDVPVFVLIKVAATLNSIGYYNDNAIAINTNIGLRIMRIAP